MNHWKPLGLHDTLVVNFVKIATMFANLDFLEKSLVNFAGIGPCTCQEICIIICSFNFPKFMKSCRANLSLLYRVSPKKYTTLHLRCSVLKPDINDDNQH